VSPERQLSIGVDIGGTTIKSGVVDTAKGKVLKTTIADTPRANSKDIAKLVARQINILLHSFTEITQVGVGVPGSLNEERTLVQYPPNFPLWESEPFAEYLRKELPHFDKVEIDNDANAATLAEATLGAGKGESHFLLATLGTGVGGGIWSNGCIYRGKYGGAGEFGHISIDYNGPLCGCGAKGCIEAFIGKNYLVTRTIEKLLSSGSASSLTKYLPTKSLDPKHISEAANNGDVFAQGVLTEAGIMLGSAMASVAKLLDIRTFIVSGGIAEAGEHLLKPARTALLDNVFTNQKIDTILISSSLGEDTGIIGASLLPTYL
jgi:glucokinase